jgi:hypothetical protein
MTLTVDQGESDRHDVTTVEVSDRASDYLRTLDRMIRLTSLADTKAAPVLAAQATVAAVTVTQAYKVQDLVSAAAPGTLVIVGLLAALYLISTAISMALTLRVFLPKDAPGQGSLLYFADIANMSVEDFVRESTALSDEDLERDALVQTHIVASIAATKFRRVRLALLLMIAALAGWLPLMAMANY